MRLVEIIDRYSQAGGGGKIVNARRLLSLLGVVCISFGVAVSPAATLTESAAGVIPSVTFAGTPAKPAVGQDR